MFANQSIARAVAALFSLAMLAGATPSRAAIVTYQFTASGGNYGTFSYDDANSTTISSPLGGTAYSALSFSVDGTALANPQIAIYPNFGGNQYVEIGTSAGFSGTLLELGHIGTNLFSSAALSQLDNRTAADFRNTSVRGLDYGGAKYSLLSLNQIAVPIPPSLPLLLSGLAALGVAGRRTRLSVARD